MAADARRPQPYTAPRKPASIARQAQCLSFAAQEHGHGFWSYIARYSDVTAFQMKGWPDGYKWLDLPETLSDAAATFGLLAELAALKGEAAVITSLKAAIEKAKAERSAE